jgi:hypothetical protein
MRRAEEMACGADLAHGLKRQRVGVAAGGSK